MFDYSRIDYLDLCDYLNSEFICKFTETYTEFLFDIWHDILEIEDIEYTEIILKRKDVYGHTYINITVFSEFFKFEDERFKKLEEYKHINKFINWYLDKFHNFKRIYI